MNSFSCVLGLPPDELSPNARVHWSAKARATRAYREDCGWRLKQAKPAGWKAGRAVVDVLYRAYRGCGGYHPRDEDNARAALKAAFDALKDAGVVQTDAKAGLQWGAFKLVTTAREAKALGAGVTLTVRAA